MKAILVLAALATAAALHANPASAEVLDCRDYMARHDAIMAEVATRSPGNETDAKRDAARRLVVECKRAERQEAIQQIEDAARATRAAECPPGVLPGSPYCR